MSKKNFFSGKEFLTNALFGNNNFIKKRKRMNIVPPVEGVFKTPYDQYRHLDGKPYLLTGMVDPRTTDYNDVGPLWLVEIEGNVIQAWPDELHVKNDERIKLYEITLPGFNGATDETDHLVKWVVARSPEEALKVAEHYHPQIMEARVSLLSSVVNSSAGIDYSITDIENRLEYLRQELRAERISYGELHALQHLAAFIDPDDVELREAAGLSEFKNEEE